MSTTRAARSIFELYDEDRPDRPNSADDPTAQMRAKTLALLSRCEETRIEVEEARATSRIGHRRSSAIDGRSS